MKTQFFLLLTICLTGALAAQQGLKAEYFDGTNFEVKVATRTEAKIDLSWNNVPPVPGIDPHVCSIRWTGRLQAPETGTYTFSAKVDDGIRVWVGGVFVIDDWRLNDNGNFTGRVLLEKGKQYDLKVEYFNALIEGEVRLLWQLPDAKTPVVIDSKYFYQTPKTTPPKTPSKPPVKENKPAAVKPKPKPDAGQKIPEEKPKPPTPPVVSADTIQKYIPKNLLFEQSKSIMLPPSRAELDRLAGFLNRYPHLRLKIEGHTDIIGDQDMNKTLSEERANVVAQYLMQQGIDTGRIEAKGYGSSRPLVTGNSKKGYPENRRVAFIIK